MTRLTRPTVAAGVVVAAALVGTLGWMLAQPEPQWTDVYKGSVTHVDNVQLPDEGVRQLIPGEPGTSGFAVPYRLIGAGPARVTVTVLTTQGAVLARRDVQLARTDTFDLGRVFRPADPWGADTELLTVRFTPTRADLVLEVVPDAGSPRPLLLENPAGTASLPAAIGSDGLAVSVLVSQGADQPALTRIPLYLSRIADVGAAWMPPAVLAAAVALMVALTLPLMVASARMVDRGA